MAETVAVKEGTVITAEEDSDNDSDVNPLLGNDRAAGSRKNTVPMEVDLLLDRFGPFQWRLFAILGLGTFSVPAGLTMLPVFTNEDLNEINAEAFDKRRMAVGSSLFFACWGVTAPLFALASDRRGRKPVVVVMLLATVIVGCLPVLVADLPSSSHRPRGSEGNETHEALSGAGKYSVAATQLVAARALLGVCIAGLGTGPGYVLLMEWTPVAHRARVTVALNSSWAIVAMIYAGVAYSIHEVQGAEGWRTMQLCATLPLLGVLVSAITARSLMLIHTDC